MECAQFSGKTFQQSWSCKMRLHCCVVPTNARTSTLYSSIQSSKKSGWAERVQHQRQAKQQEERTAERAQHQRILTHALTSLTLIIFSGLNGCRFVSLACFLPIRGISNNSQHHFFLMRTQTCSGRSTLNALCKYARVQNCKCAHTLEMNACGVTCGRLSRYLG